MDYEAAACWVNEYADVLEDLANHRLAGEAEEHAIKTWHLRQEGVLRLAAEYNEDLAKERE